jgi:hypothetical protein
MDAAKKASERKGNGEGENSPCIRISNNRYAKDATFEEQLTAEDKVMLKEMGVAVVTE